MSLENEKDISNEIKKITQNNEQDDLDRFRPSNRIPYILYRVVYEIDYKAITWMSLHSMGP